jgi:hypothetical protein
VTNGFSAVKTATISSTCECQGRLYAELDENKQVLRGWATDRRRGKTRPAPSHVMHCHSDRFDVGWFCPFCVRNTLRSFDAGGIAWREPAASASSGVKS